MGVLLTNVSQIPAFFGDLNQDIFRIALFFIMPLFAAAVLDENISAVQGKANYTALFIRLGLVLSLLILYQRVFLLVVDGMQFLAGSILPEDEFFKVLKTIFKELPRVKLWNFFNFTKINIMGAMLLVSYVTSFIILKLFFVLRFMLLTLLYVLGPIQIVFGIYKRTSGSLKSWFVSLFQVSAWIVILNLLIRITSVLTYKSVLNFQDTNTLIALALNILVAVLFIFTPYLTGILLSGGNIGGVGSALVGVATAGTLHFARFSRGSSRGAYLLGGAVTDKKGVE